jgi:excinuclease UvrABC nuclease subunit
MNDAGKVEARVKAYCDKYFIPQFELSDIIEIDSLRQRKRNIAWPHGDDAGCYAMFGKEKELLYIGLARHLASRLNNWFRYHARDDDSLPWTSSAVGSWKTQPKFIRTIRVNHPYEAPSLEAFLIGALVPPENINLKNISAFSQ